MYLLFSIILFTIGNLIKSYRSIYILKPYVDKPIKNYLRSFFIGFIIDFFFPFRISDLVRTFIFSKSTKSSWRMSLALAFIERVFDLIIIFSILLFFGIKSISLLSLFLFATIIFLYCNFIYLKKLYYLSSSIFNNFIQSFLLGLYWSLYRLKIDIIHNKRKLVTFSILSIFMWFFNIASVILLSYVIKLVSLKELILHQFTDLTSAGLIKSLALFYSKEELFYYFLYLILPNIITFLISYLPFNEKDKKSSLKMIPFVSSDISLSFFKYYFNNNYTSNDETYYNMTNNASIIKDMSAASEAKTYLMQDGDKLFVRKIALSNASIKLRQQYNWLLENKNNLPLPKIIRCVDDNNLFSYDMEYFSNGETFFTTIHYLSHEDSWLIIKDILKLFDNLYYKKNDNINYKETIDNIYNEHIYNNIEFINNSKYRYLKNYSYLIVNNKKVPNILNMLQELKEYHYSLDHVIQYIHGDLTIENILVDNNKNYILIDPAPRFNNIFAEFAKLFQSLHGKYEYVKNINNYSIEDNVIVFPDYSTLKYDRIFLHIREYIIKYYGEKGLKTIYFYEAICYIRAIVYMIKLGKSNAILMLALSGLALKEWQNIK